MNIDRQNAVVDAIWPWRVSKADVPAQKPAQRRKRAMIESCVGFTVATVLLAFTGKKTMGCVVLGISSTVLMGGLFIPPVYYGFRKFGMLLARIVGVGLSWILLLPFFYLCFTIGRLCVVISRKDPLARACPTDQKSYWVKHDSRTSKESYERQY